MTIPKLVSGLRATDWSDVPTSPGVYWWYFPRSALDDLGIGELTDVNTLNLRHTHDDKVCLYHGMASNLSDRMAWHAAQRLTPNVLQTGFLSTFRFTLLALNNFDYPNGEEQINRYFDNLSVAWCATATREEARQMEQDQLQGEYHYPLNIQGNQRDEIAQFVRHLRLLRKTYKQRFVR